MEAQEGPSVEDISLQRARLHFHVNLGEGICCFYDVGNLWSALYLMDDRTMSSRLAVLFVVVFVCIVVVFGRIYIYIYTYVCVCMCICGCVFYFRRSGCGHCDQERFLGGRTSPLFRRLSDVDTRSGNHDFQMIFSKHQEPLLNAEFLNRNCVKLGVWNQGRLNARCSVASECVRKLPVCTLHTLGPLKGCYIMFLEFMYIP